MCERAGDMQVPQKLCIFRILKKCGLWNCRNCCVGFLWCFFSACFKIPDDDAAFLTKFIPVGLGHEKATGFISKRGFTEKQLRYNPAYFFDQTTKSFVAGQFEYHRYIAQNIGFVKVVGKPEGRLFCFKKSYTYLVASGIRIICWTVDNQNMITWRQAGWNGAGL